MREIRSNQLKADINENKDDLKCIHQIVGDAMYINMDKPLPLDIDGSNLPEEFINQFQIVLVIPDLFMNSIQL